MASPAVTIAAATLALLAARPAAAQATLTPPDWNLGRIEIGGTVTRIIKAGNPGDRATEVSLVSTCGCLEAFPSRLYLAPGADGAIELRYTPEEPGKVDVSFVVRSAPPEPELGAGTAWLYRVTGMVNPPSKPYPAQAPPPPGSQPAGGISEAGAGPSVLLYYAPGCRSCEQLAARLEARLSGRPGGPAALSRRNVLEPAVFEELSAAAGPSGPPALPAAVVGGRVLSGVAEIEDGLEAALAAHGSVAASAPPVPAPEAGIARRLAPAALFAAGLVDGVNPCAFTTIIFLLTSLVLAGRRRAEILLAGSAFTFAVFAAYFLVGVGLFHSLRAAASFPLVSSALRWALVAVLLALAALSVRDFALARSGRAGEMALRLPDPIKRRMQRTILDNARSSAIVGGSLVLGAVVSLFELACTGQVYFPAVAWLVRTQGGLGAYLLLAVYNAGFVLPLAVVFVLAWRGVSSRTLTRAAQAHLGTVKLALAVVFVGLAALTLAT